MLLDPAQAAAFLLAAMAITVAPGPDNLMVLSLGMARGRRAGMAFGLGCAAGCLSHTALAAIGLSAVIAASATAFTALKIVGGLYLMWLGVQAWRSRGTIRLAADAAAPRGLGALFAKGIVANAVNPKVILFFLAFLPQFVDAGRGDVGWQTAQLGALFTVQGAVLFGAFGWFAGIVGQRLARTPTAGVWLDRVAGSVFILLGARLIAAR